MEKIKNFQTTTYLQDKQKYLIIQEMIRGYCLLRDKYDDVDKYLAISREIRMLEFKAMAVMHRLKLHYPWGIEWNPDDYEKYISGNDND